MSLSQMHYISVTYANCLPPHMIYEKHFLFRVTVKPVELVQPFLPKDFCSFGLFWPRRKWQCFIQLSFTHACSHHISRFSLRCTWRFGLEKSHNCNLASLELPRDQLITTNTNHIDDWCNQILLINYASVIFSILQRSLLANCFTCTHSWPGLS